jgi:cytochrome c oxidase subunit IV
MTLFILVLTGIEVILAYYQAAPALMLTVLIGLSTLKAIYIIGYFMHLKYEQPRLKWILWPASILLMLSLLAMLPDAAHGQCIMCQRTAAAQDNARRQTLNKGIWILGLPPLAMMAAILHRATRRKNRPQ